MDIFQELQTFNSCVNKEGKPIDFGIAGNIRLSPAPKGKKGFSEAERELLGKYLALAAMKHKDQIITTAKALFEEDYAATKTKAQKSFDKMIRKGS